MANGLSIIICPGGEYEKLAIVLEGNDVAEKLKNKIFHPAQVKINAENKSSLIVWNDSIKNPLSVRYAFKSRVDGILYNTQGLPASSFRTNDW